MTVSAILSDKGASTIISLPPGATLAEICDTLAAHRIGAVLIMDGSDINGIVSERDVVRILSWRRAVRTAAAPQQGPLPELP